ncbi:MAG: nuclease, partial [Actinobacteria bacterium]|nr:nuclease [Actinomycetota bacterium]
FGDLLTEEEILAVVRYEREILGGETESALAGGQGGESAGEAPASEAQSEGGADSAGGGSGG